MKSFRKSIFLSIFFTSTALLSYEVFLTRILSALFLKYFSVLAISAAMAGLGIAGIFVQLYLKDKNAESKQNIYYISAVFLSLSLIIIPLFCTYVRVPSLVIEVSNLFMVGLFIGLCIIPFFFGGVILALAYHTHIDKIEKVYFFDLLGAGIGCLLAFILLNKTDGFSAVFFSAILAQLALLSIAFGMGRFQKLAAGISTVIILGLFVFNHYSATWKLPHPSGRKDATEFERWSEFGLTTIASKSYFTGRGISKKKEAIASEAFKVISQDYNSSTHAVNAAMPFDELEKIKNQIDSFPLLFKESPNVLVLGAGGGKDVFAALLCNSAKVTAVEFNRTIVNDIMRGYLRDFSGRLYDNPKVEVIIDEARNYLKRTKDKFNIILPVTGTTPRLIAAGCYGFSTEYLQTKEAYIAYLNHLTPKGIFGLSAAFNADTLEHEFQPAYRILATIKESLEDSGRNPAEHIMVVGGRNRSKLPDFGYSVSVIFSPAAFSEADILRADKIAHGMGYELIFSPYYKKTGLLSRFLVARDNKAFYKSAPMNIAPVADDNPYYYNYLKPENIFSWHSIPQYVKFLISILIIFLIYLLLLVILPMFNSFSFQDRKKHVYSFRRLFYFALLGLSFICLELTMMQWVSAFIGIPTYGFFTTVAAFTLSMGAGSLLAGKIGRQNIKKLFRSAVFLLAGLLFSYWLFWADITIELAHLPVGYKIFLCIAMLFPIGFICGLPFVFGMRLLDDESKNTVAWMWAINTTTSTIGAVLVALCWLLLGYNNTVILAFAGYLLSALII